jgi:hypothetical protein
MRWRAQALLKQCPRRRLPRGIGQHRGNVADKMCVRFVDTYLDPYKSLARLFARWAAIEDFAFTPIALKFPEIGPDTRLRGYL